MCARADTDASNRVKARLVLKQAGANPPTSEWWLDCNEVEQRSLLVHLDGCSAQGRERKWPADCHADHLVVFNCHGDHEWCVVAHRDDFREGIRLEEGRAATRELIPEQPVQLFKV